MSFTELMLIIFSIGVLIVVITLSIIYINSAQNKINNFEFQKISFNLPKILTKTFLYQKVNDSVKKELNLDINKVYYVKDIIKLSNAKSMKFVKEIRENFLDNLSKNYVDTFNKKDYLYLYNKYSGDTLKSSDLLYFSVLKNPNFNSNNNNNNIHNNYQKAVSMNFNQVSISNLGYNIFNYYYKIPINGLYKGNWYVIFFKNPNLPYPSKNILVWSVTNY